MRSLRQAALLRATVADTIQYANSQNQTVNYLKLRLSLSIKLQGKDSSGITLPYRWESENQADREADEVTAKGKEQEEERREKKKKKR